jgi:hypothetical protein
VAGREIGENMKEIITFEPPETVVVILQGKLDPDEIEKMFDKWETFKTPNNEYKVLADLSELQDMPPKVREILSKRGRKLHVAKVALFGASTKLRIMAGLIVKMVPTIDASTFVKTEDEARAWLGGE